MGRKPKRKLTAAEKAAKRKRREETMIVFINGKQKRVKRPLMIDGMDVDEFIRQNADPIWLHQNEMWELMEENQVDIEQQYEEREMDHDTVVKQWQQYAKRNNDKNYAFLRSMKFEDYSFEPDELAAKLHKEIFGSIDCTRCANCCKTMRLGLNDEDIIRITKHLGMSIGDFTERYLDSDDKNDLFSEEPQKALKQQPCPFLDGDNRCSIYEVRPEVCREYPHTDKEGFVFRTMGIADNALNCPAVFWIVERMKDEARWLRRGFRDEEY